MREPVWAQGQIWEQARPAEQVLVWKQPSPLAEQADEEPSSGRFPDEELPSASTSV